MGCSTFDKHLILVNDRLQTVITRRGLFLGALVLPMSSVGKAQSAGEGRMLLGLHQNTSSGAGYQGSLEGWAQAGIRYVELNDRLLDEFLENESLQTAGRAVSYTHLRAHET